MSGIGGGGPVIEEGSPVERVMWGMERARRSSWVVVVVVVIGEEDMVTVVVMRRRGRAKGDQLVRNRQLCVNICRAVSCGRAMAIVFLYIFVGEKKWTC